MVRLLQIHWEYDSGDYWVRLRGQELSEELREDLQAWNDQVSRLPCGRPGQLPDRARLDQLNAMGMRLAERARQELDATWVVEYADLFLDEPVRLPLADGPSAAGRRRPHRG